jgi:hypothetical protein
MQAFSGFRERIKNFEIIYFEIMYFIGLPVFTKLGRSHTPELESNLLFSYSSRTHFFEKSATESMRFFC